MNASIPQSRQSWPVWSGVLVWLVAFFSPAAYWLLMLLADRYHISVPPVIVVSLFFLILVVALVVCGTLAWRSSKKIAPRIGWLVFTVVAMVIQLGFIGCVLRAILVAKIGYAQ